MWMHFFLHFSSPLKCNLLPRGQTSYSPLVQLSVINNTAALGQFTNKVTIDHQLAKLWPAPQRLQPFEGHFYVYKKARWQAINYHPICPPDKDFLTW